MKTGLWLLFAIVAFQASAQNIVTNGSFESFGTSINGWSTTEGWTWAGANPSAADGQAFVMLSGNLYQDLPTIPGQVYQLRYAMAGDPYYQGPVTLQTYWAGSLVATTVFDTTGHSNENLGWIFVTNNLLATGPLTRLWFANPSYGSSVIPDLDAVSVIPVNETPTTCISAPSGILGWWKGQNNAADSATGYQGTLLNGTTFSNGIVGQAFYFAGSNQCVQIPYSTNLAVSNYSIEAWIEPLAPIDPSTQAVLFAQNNGQCQLLARAGASGVRIALQFAVDASTSVGVESSTEIPIGQFSHVAGTWDGSTLLLYINGAPDSHSTPGVLPYNSACPFYIGGIYNTTISSCSNVAGFFNGVIDEVSYYRRALSDAEMSLIFNASGLGKCSVPHPPAFTLQPTNKTAYVGSTVTFYAGVTGDSPVGYQWQFNGINLSGQTFSFLTLTNLQPAKAGNYSVLAVNDAGTIASSNALLTILPQPPCVTITNGLVSWWRAETNLLDGWGSNDGTLLLTSNRFVFPGITVLSVSYAPGKVGQALNPITNGVLVPDNVSLKLTNGFTIEAWIYPTTLFSLRTIFSKFDPPVVLATNNNSYYLGANNGFVTLRVSPNGRDLTTLTAPQPLRSSQWSHVAASYDGAALRLYVNGLLIAQTNYSAGIFEGVDDVGIGAIPYQQRSWYSQWAGYLDEISLYNRALSDSEILDIVNADLTGKCLVPPSITVQPQSQAVPLNEDAIFSPQVFGSKPLQYQWQFNGINLLGATSSVLALEHVQSNRVGNYSFVVTNTMGRATSSVAALSLLPPLSCVSAPPGMVAWWPADNFTNDVIGTNNASLSPPIFFGSSGYAVGKVGNCFNITNERPLTVASSPALNFGSNADFSIEGWCKVIPPTGFIKSPLLPNLNIVQKTGSREPNVYAGYSLFLQNGRLGCQIGNIAFPPTALPTFVSPGPDILDGLFHHFAFTFHRSVADGGCLYIDGHNVLTFDTRPFGQTSFSNSVVLYIGDSTFAFVGNPTAATERIDELSFYSRALSPTEILSICQAGSAGKCIPPPTISVQPTNQLVQAGGVATLGVVASGFPTLGYQWLKNGANVPGATNSLLIISNTTVANAGQYSLRVSNIGGLTNSAIATLTVNRPPIARNLNTATTQNNPISISIDKLLLYASDPDADPLSLATIATTGLSGGSVVRGATDITYTPPNNFIGSDSFSYSVSDGRGGSGSALVIVQVRSADDMSGNLLPLISITGGFSVSFAGIPGRTYTLQRAESVTGPWTNLISVLVGPNGLGTYDDTNSPPPIAFYRTVFP